MPIWIRRFTFQKLKEYYDKQSDQQQDWERAQKTQQPQILKPGVEPSYSTKTSPK